METDEAPAVCSCFDDEGGPRTDIGTTCAVCADLQQQAHGPWLAHTASTLFFACERRPTPGCQQLHQSLRRAGSPRTAPHFVSLPVGAEMAATAVVLSRPLPLPASEAGAFSSTTRSADHHIRAICFISSGGRERCSDVGCGGSDADGVENCMATPASSSSSFISQAYSSFCFRPSS